jgi:hypothetical protein
MKYVKPLANIACKFNLRRCIEALQYYVQNRVPLR